LASITGPSRVVNTLTVEYRPIDYSASSVSCDQETPPRHVTPKTTEQYWIVYAL